jgi:acyl carrier protein
MDAFLTGAGSAGSTSARSRDTMDRIRRVFVESLHLNLKEADLDYEHKLDESVGLDSLAVLEFITALEKEFGFTIDPEMLKLDFIRDLPRLASYIEERAARLPRPPA